MDQSSRISELQAIIDRLRCDVDAWRQAWKWEQAQKLELQRLLQDIK